MRRNIFLWSVCLGSLLVMSCSKNKEEDKEGEVSVQSVLPTKGDLTKAAFEGNADLVNQLLTRGADVNENIGDEGQQLTPIVAALIAGKEDIVTRLVSAGANANVSVGGFELIEVAQHLQQAQSFKILRKVTPYEISE